MTMEIKTYLSRQRALVEEGLKRYMPSATGPYAGYADHLEAMQYSLFVGGKRVRPILCLAAARAICDQSEMEAMLMPVACALECIHTYSLIHDDLPAMDDDSLRRGKPTNHILYGEAAAILAGDSLLTYAFELLSDPTTGPLAADRRLAIISLIAKAAGPGGMVGGQALDIASENSSYPFSTLQTIHRGKTGALITASVLAGAIGAGANSKQQQALAAYGEHLGLAFQIVDDLLDSTATTEELGKTAGADAIRGKATYPGYFGIEKTREKAKDAVNAAIDAIRGLDGSAQPLRALAEYVYTRSN